MESREFFYRLCNAITKMDAIYEEYAKGCGVNSSNLLWILYGLSDGKSHSQRQICEDWAIPRSTANTIIKYLESNEYIILNQIKGKRREMNIILTDKGQEYANTLLKDLFNKEDAIFYDNQAKATELLLDLEEFTKQLEGLTK